MASPARAEGDLYPQVFSGRQHHIALPGVELCPGLSIDLHPGDFHGWVIDQRDVVPLPTIAPVQLEMEYGWFFVHVEI